MDLKNNRSIEKIHWKSVEGVVANQLCCHCGSCEACCPQNAIQVTARESFITPVVNLSLCNECGICLEICPGHEIDFSYFNRKLFGAERIPGISGIQRRSVVGRVKNRDVSHVRTSGGLTKELASYGLKAGLWDGVVVSNLVEGALCLTETSLVTELSRIENSSNSIYCPVAAAKVIREIKDFDGRVCFIGLPCHIHALRKAQEKFKWLRSKIAFVIALFCSGTPGIYATRYFLKSHKLQEDDVQAIQYRSPGWPGDIVISLKDGTSRSFPRGKRNSFINHLKFASAFHHGGAFFDTRCSMCTDYFGELSDISLGDAWNLNRDDSEGGWNVALIRSEKADTIIETLDGTNSIVVEPIGLQQVVLSHTDSLYSRKNLAPIFAIQKKKGMENPRYFQSCKYDQDDLFLSLQCYLNNFQRILARRELLWWGLKYLTLVKLLVKKANNKKTRTMMKQWLVKQK